MPTEMPDPPTTPVKPAVTTPLEGVNEETYKLKESASQQDLNGYENQTEALAFREGPEKIELDSRQPSVVIKDQRASQSQNPQQHEVDVDPAAVRHETAVNPQSPDLFDWDNFEARYDHAMAEAKAVEEGLLAEFQELSGFFGTWASAASEHDDDRALKRLKTRETYIQTAEQSLEQKKIHHAQVVEAFKNALAMLGGP